MKKDLIAKYSCVTNKDEDVMNEYGLIEFGNLHMEITIEDCEGCSKGSVALDRGSAEDLTGKIFAWLNQ